MKTADEYRLVTGGRPEMIRRASSAAECSANVTSSTPNAARLRQGTWMERREECAERLLREIERYAPNFRRALIDYVLLTPADLDREWDHPAASIGRTTLEKMASVGPRHHRQHGEEIRAATTG